MGDLGLLIDYEFCTGCHSCEVACRNEHNLPLDKWGIRLTEVPPFEYEHNKWEWNYVPVPTALCDMCADRLAKGRKPACVHHCLSFCIDYGTPDDLSVKLAQKGTKVALFMP